MTNIWNGKRCPMCAKGTLHSGSKEIAYPYKGYTYTSVRRGAFCDNCDEGFVESDKSEEMHGSFFEMTSMLSKALSWLESGRNCALRNCKLDELQAVEKMPFRDMRRAQSNQSMR
jgi:YgiT-type zinc finger domain-containing protein